MLTVAQIFMQKFARTAEISTKVAEGYFYDLIKSDKIKLHYNLSRITRECVHLVTLVHFRSCDKDDGRTI